MYKSHPVTALLVIAAATTSVFSAERELFSDIRSGSVFAPSSGTVSTTSTVPQQGASKISDTEQLVRILTEVGFTATQDDSRTVSTNASTAAWSLPVEITLSEDKSRLTIALFLSVIEKEESLTTANLLAMLEANRKHAPASFGYNSELKRFEIDHVVTNHNVTANVLRNAIDRLAKIAAETESFWQVQSTTATTGSDTTATTSTTTSTTTTTTPEPTPSLVGQWSATRSKTEAFAIQFKADNTFVLVYVNNGKQTKSSGKFTITGGKLTLEGEDGFRLAGAIKSTDEKQFQFAIENSKSAPLAFQRAK